MNLRFHKGEEAATGFTEEEKDAGCSFPDGVLKGNRICSRKHELATALMNLRRLKPATTALRITFNSSAGKWTHRSTGNRDQRANLTKEPQMNAIMVLYPYKNEGMWVFDDERTGLVCRPTNNFNKSKLGRHMVAFRFF
jgi:hypothetical protein